MFPVFQFIRHWLHRVDAHSLHSPFLYNLYTQVVKADDATPFKKLDQLRDKLLTNGTALTIEDLGAGSRMDNGSQRSIKSIARHASTPARFSRLLARTIAYFGHQHILELGTSLGLNTLHLQTLNPTAQIHTLEGSTTIASVAQQHFDELGAQSVNLTVGNIDNTLAEVIAAMPQLDFVYMDANHRYEPTLRYFDMLQPKLHKASLVVVDDIHWSKEMNQAWQVLKEKPEVSLALDFFEAGFLFFDPELPKESYLLSY